MHAWLLTESGVCEHVWKVAASGIHLSGAVLHVSWRPISFLDLSASLGRRVTLVPDV